MKKTVNGMRKTAMKEEIYRFCQRSENKELIDLSMCGITFPDKNYRIARRGSSHTSCIEYVEEGTGCVHIDSEVFYPSAGDSYFLQQGRSQYYYSDKDRPWKKYFLNFSGKLATSLTEGYGLASHSHFAGLSIKEELLAIIEIAKHSEGDPTAEIVGILNGVFLKLRAHARADGSGVGIAERAREFLETKTISRFRIEELCRHVQRSESQIIRIFKKAYGVTPYAYLLEKKLELAGQLLRDTNLSVREIAEKLSFADEYYFSNVFKKKMGVTPSLWRTAR